MQVQLVLGYPVDMDSQPKIEVRKQLFLKTCHTDFFKFINVLKSGY